MSRHPETEVTYGVRRRPYEDDYEEPRRRPPRSAWDRITRSKNGEVNVGSIVGICSIFSLVITFMSTYIFVTKDDLVEAREFHLVRIEKNAESIGKIHQLASERAAILESLQTQINELKREIRDLEKRERK